jgi:hypothetical protein
VGEFDNYAAQAPQSGKLATYTFFGLRNPDGTHPKVHVEFIDDKAWNQHLISIAGKTDGDEILAANREIVVRHVKRIEHVYRKDGSAADDTDIAKFIHAIPAHDFGRLFTYARNDEQFRAYANPETVAGK